MLLRVGSWGSVHVREEWTTSYCCPQSYTRTWLSVASSGTCMYSASGKRFNRCDHVDHFFCLPSFHLSFLFLRIMMWGEGGNYSFSGFGETKLRLPCCIISPTSNSSSFTGNDRYQLAAEFQKHLHSTASAQQQRQRYNTSGPRNVHINRNGCVPPFQLVTPPGFQVIHIPKGALCIYFCSWSYCCSTYVMLQ